MAQRSGSSVPSGTECLFGVEGPILGALGVETNILRRRSQVLKTYLNHVQSCTMYFFFESSLLNGSVLPAIHAVDVYRCTISILDSGFDSDTPDFVFWNDT